MEQTEHYQLCLWDEDDRILREDFNNDNQKIENALEGLKTLCNCQIYLQPYTGTGEAGPITHTFPHRPVFICVMASGTFVCGTRGVATLYGRTSINTYVPTDISWGENSVTIGNADWTATYCLNIANVNYRILALLDVTA